MEEGSSLTGYERQEVREDEDECLVPARSSPSGWEGDFRWIFRPRKGADVSKEESVATESAIEMEDQLLLLYIAPTGLQPGRLETAAQAPNLFFGGD